MKHRLFIALNISGQLKNNILHWQQQNHHLSVRWVLPENLHITLIPPWEAENTEQIIALLQSSLKNLLPTNNFAIKFERLSFGPDGREPRLIWLKANTPPAMTALKIQLEKLLQQLPARNNYLTHLTIARFRPENLANFPFKELDQPINWQETINSLVLLESILKPSGAEYQILLETKLN